jgi:hypothetical protein
MSALPPKADVNDGRCHVRFVPNGQTFRGAPLMSELGQKPKNSAGAFVVRFAPERGAAMNNFR